MLTDHMCIVGHLSILLKNMVSALQVTCSGAVDSF